MRLFVSIDLPDPICESIGLLQGPLRDVPGLLLTDPDQAHFTLKFLGATDRSQLSSLDSALKRAVRAVDQSPFDISLGGFGAFPNTEYIRVVWLGVMIGLEEMRALHEAVERETTEIGFDAEDHDFTPHVTLARMQHAGGKKTVQQFIEQPPTSVGSFTVSRISLKESVSTDSGPVYETVEEYQLSR